MSLQIADYLIVIFSVRGIVDCHSLVLPSILICVFLYMLRWKAYTVQRSLGKFIVNNWSAFRSKINSCVVKWVLLTWENPEKLQLWTRTLNKHCWIFRSLESKRFGIGRATRLIIVKVLFFLLFYLLVGWKYRFYVRKR